MLTKSSYTLSVEFSRAVLASARFRNLWISTVYIKDHSALNRNSTMNPKDLARPHIATQRTFKIEYFGLHLCRLSTRVHELHSAKLLFMKISVQSSKGFYPIYAFSHIAHLSRRPIALRQRVFFVTIASFFAGRAECFLLWCATTIICLSLSILTNTRLFIGEYLRSKSLTGFTGKPHVLTRPQDVVATPQAICLPPCGNRMSAAKLRITSSNFPLCDSLIPLVSLQRSYLRRQIVYVACLPRSETHLVIDHRAVFQVIVRERKDGMRSTVTRQVDLLRYGTSKARDLAPSLWSPGR